MDDLRVVDGGGEAVALRDLRGEIGVLHVLVRLGDGALGEAVPLVHAGNDEPRRAVGREHDLEVRDLALADALQLALVAELDLDGGAGLELVALGPLAADVREVDPEAAGPVHVVGDADPNYGARQLRVGSGTVHKELEMRHPMSVVRQRKAPSVSSGQQERG